MSVKVKAHISFSTKRDSYISFFGNSRTTKLLTFEKAACDFASSLVSVDGMTANRSKVFSVSKRSSIQVPHPSF